MSVYRFSTCSPQPVSFLLPCAGSATGIWLTGKNQRAPVKRLKKMPRKNFTALIYVTPPQSKAIPILAFAAKGQRQAPLLPILKYEIAISIIFIQLIGNHPICGWDLERRDFLQKLNTRIHSPYDPAIPCLGIYPGEEKTCSWKYFYRHSHSSFIHNSPNLEATRCSPACEWIMNCALSSQWILLTTKTKWVTDELNYMDDLRNFILSERSQVQNST